MLSSLKNGWLWLIGVILCCLPSLVFAGGSVHVSGYFGPLLMIVVIVVLAAIFLWAIGYWSGEMSSVFPILPKILKFMVCVVAIIWIVLIIANMIGVRIT